MTAKLYRKVFLVNLLMQICSMIASVASSMIISSYMGQDMMAAYGICGPYMTFGCFVGFIFTNGCSFICSRLLGSGKKEEAREIFVVTFVVLFLVSLAVSVICIIFADPLAMLLGANGDSLYLKDSVVLCLRGLLIGFPFYTLFLLCSPMCIIDGGSVRNRIAGILYTVMTVLIQLFNAFILKEKASIFISGLAVSLSYFVALVILASKFLEKDSLFNFKVKHLDLKVIKDILKNGFASGFVFCFYMTVQILSNQYANKIYGSMGVTAMSVGYNTWSLICCFATAIALSTSNLSSMYFGERDKQGIKNTYKEGIIFSLSIQVIVSVLLIIFRKEFALLFLDANYSNELMNLSTTLIICALVGAIFASIQNASVSYYQSINKPNTALLYTFIYFICDALISRVFMCGVFKEIGIKLIFFTGNFSTVFVFFIYSLIKSKDIKHPIKSYAMLPDYLNISKNDYFFKKIDSLEDAIEFRDLINNECKKHNIDPIRSNKLRLCIEEMLVNVLDHGFTKDKKKHILEAKVVFTKDELILRVTDDCVRFNLRDKYKAITEKTNDEKASLGLFLLINLSKELKCTYTLNTNNVIMTF